LDFFLGKILEFFSTLFSKWVLTPDQCFKNLNQLIPFGNHLPLLVGSISFKL